MGGGLGGKVPLYSLRDIFFELTMKRINNIYIKFFIIFSALFLQYCSDPIATDTDRIYKGKLNDYINVMIIPTQLILLSNKGKLNTIKIN